MYKNKNFTHNMLHTMKLPRNQLSFMIRMTLICEKNEDVCSHFGKKRLKATSGIYGNVIEISIIRKKLDKMNSFGDLQR